MQKADAKRYRDRFKATGKSPTYEEARSDAKKQLTAKNPGPGLSDQEADCVLLEVDRQFEEMCKKGMAQPGKFELRPPGLRGKGLPGGGGGGSTAGAF